MNHLINSLIKLFLPPQTFQRSLFTPREQHLCIQLILRAFYAIIFFLSVTHLSSWPIYLSQKEFEPLWPIYWLKYVEVQSGIMVILYLHLIGGLLAIICPQWRIARILVFLTLLEFIAFDNSFGKIDHGGHIALLLSFILILLPSEWHSPQNKSKYIRAATLTVFSGCQVLIMLTYTMSGIGKLFGVLIQAPQGEIHGLAPQALASYIANRMLHIDFTSYLGPWLVENYYVGWLLMLGTVYLQFFSLWAAFRPSLHQLWGLSLILLHISIFLTMRINFAQNCLWLGLFFVNSPFRPQKFDWRQIVRDLPLVGYGFNLLQGKSLTNL